MRLKFLLLGLLLALLGVACTDAPPPAPTPDTPTAAPTTETAEAESETAADTTDTAPEAAESEPEGEELSETTTNTDPPPTADHPLINEITIGINGNNNHEFIELYNPTDQTIDLNGWSLWHQIRTDENPQPLYRWETRTDLPPRSYLLLVRAGENVGVLADGYFETPLFNKGTLFLRNPDRADIDVLAWGDAPEGTAVGSPAPAVENGQSLLRQSANAMQDNAADFALSDTPEPQNSGEPIPIVGMPGNITIVLPENITPGQEFALIFIIANNSSEDQDVFLSLYIPDGYEPIISGVELTADRRLEGSQVVSAGASVSFELTVMAPFNYEETVFSGSFIEINGLRRYAPISHINIAGGSVPIAVAREAAGQTVTVEGIATMYTGGFFAGSSGTKFYIEDETGGVQVYVPEGINDVNIQLGDRVRVTGQQEVYRSAVEIIPNDYATDIEIIEDNTDTIEPTAVLLSDLSPESELIGRLVNVEGVATRIEEFTYSYEVDLTDEDGNTVRIYLDKLTEATTEPLIVGESYQITGIVELYDGNVQLQPRLQNDFAQIFPPVLRLEIDAPITVADAAVPYNIRVINNTPITLTNIGLATDVPTGAVGSVDLGNGITATSNIIKWAINQLVPGETFTISYTVNPTAGLTIQFPSVTATADQLTETVSSPIAVTYLGDILPIHAIQGDGFASSYAQQTVTTQGIITAIFPELGGLWIQDPAGDDNPATSEGLFVLTDGLETALLPNQSIRLSGQIRELSGQTVLEPLGDEAISFVGFLGRPEPIEMIPPADFEESRLYFEAHEGMLVQVTNGRAVSPINHFGEYAVVQTDNDIERVMRNDGNAGLMIFVDDGSTIRHEDSTTLPYAVATGDLVDNIVGPLAYTFDQYKIAPLEAPVVTAEPVTLPELPELAPNQFSVATFNVENFFDTSAPHPDNPPRPSNEEYQSKLAKLADAILRMGAPTVLGLQEVENLTVLEDLAALPALADFQYIPILEEGDDSRGIDNGYLIRGDVATIDEVEAIPAPEGLTSRPPLLVMVTIELDGASKTIFILNNHFTSMSAGEAATEPRRDAQAAWNVEIVEDIISDVEGTPSIIVLGDLNSFYDAKPLDTLRAAGLNHVYEFVEAEGSDRPYTYIFQGSGQTLDHILVTPDLFGSLVSVTALHLNADYPFAHIDNLSAQRVSDHDPLIAVFAIE